jgi:hypothetical protein
MSGIKVQANPLGAGVVTIAGPAAAADRAIALPDASGTLSMLDGPSFYARAGNSDAIALNTWTKVRCGTEEWDTHNCYDQALFRFTPNVAGIYLVMGEAYTVNPGNTNIAAIYKNGVEIRRGSQGGSAANSSWAATVAAPVLMNGTTDYLELYAWSGIANTLQAVGTHVNYFTACLVRVLP